MTEALNPVPSLESLGARASELTPSAESTLRRKALTRAHLALLEADLKQALLQGRRTSAGRRLWTAAHVRLLRAGLARQASQQAHRALTFWERSLLARPCANPSTRAHWCALYALAESPGAQRARLVEPLSLAVMRLHATSAQP